jgi:hypothetical protein
MFTSEESAPHTSAPSVSATRASSIWASEAATPSPMMIMGLLAPASIEEAAITCSGSGALRVTRKEVGNTCSSLGASRMSMGRETNTGAMGGVAAILILRRNTRSSDDGSTTRVAHLVTGLAIPTKSAAIWESMASYLTPASPLMTTKGAWPRIAWYSIPIPLPRPTPL